MPVAPFNKRPNRRRYTPGAAALGLLVIDHDSLYAVCCDTFVTSSTAAGIVQNLSIGGEPGRE